MALIGQALIRDVPNEYSIYKEKSLPSTVFARPTVTACCGITA
jgi:D-alanyl-D-alanine carboxypeptidase